MPTPHDRKPVVLITGATGYLGQRLAAHLLATTDHRLLLWVRAADRATFEWKASDLRASLGTAADRVEVSWGDLNDPEPFARIDPDRIVHIVHGAAAISFALDRDTARRVNVDGTRRLLDFARRCPALKSVNLLSSIYASGLTAGPVRECPVLWPPAFANHYEWSKWSAEHLAVTQYADLPWRIIRTATVLADDASGRVSQHNALHNTLRLLFHGLLSLVPGRRDTPVFLVTGDFVVDGIAALLDGAETHRVYNLAHRADESITLGGLVDVVLDRFGQAPSFRQRRILAPLFCDEAAFAALADGANAFADSILGKALASVRPFAPQLFVHKDVENAAAMAALPGYAAPEPAALLSAISDDLIRSGWGARP